MANLDWPGVIKGPEQLLTGAQDLTGTWADLGDKLFVAGARSLGLWLDLDINNSQNARVRLLAIWEDDAAADEYVLPIRTVGASDVKVEDEYIEFNVDADQKMLLSWDLDGLVPRVQVQVMAGVLGAAPVGQIETAYVTTAV